MNSINKITRNFLNITKFANNKPIATCKFSIHDNSTFIHNIYVNKEFRNKKIGSTLLQEVEQYSARKNIENISLVAHQVSNDSLIDFYKKNGYYQTNDKINYYDDGETTYDLIKMIKRL